MAQSAPPAPTPLPKDPQALLDLARPYYNFNDAAMMPWHLKANYQLYDQKGNPTESGVFEYWWVAPNVSRSSWTRDKMSLTDWHTADGKFANLSTGGGMQFYEARLPDAIVDALGDARKADPANTILKREEVKSNKFKFPCVMVAPKMPQYGKIFELPLGLFPTYCFDEHLPALRTSTAFSALTVRCNSIASFQGKYLAKQFDIYEGKQKIRAPQSAR